MSGAGPDVALFEEIRAVALQDTAVLALWLGGSRAVGRANLHSDHDCGLIVADDAAERFTSRFASAATQGVDLMILTLGQFQDLAEWGSAEAWMRWGFSRAALLVDKTACVRELMAQKGRVPPLQVAGFVGRSADHFTNQIYRALKCRRDGDATAAALEAAEATAPLLDALFAINDGRLRPYYRYLGWELESHPLHVCPWTPVALIDALISLPSAESSALRALFGTAERFFRRSGHGDVLDAWGPTLAWMLES